MKKRLVTLAMAGLMAMSSVTPAMAVDLTAYYGKASTEIKSGVDENGETYRYAAGKAKDAHWMWIDGYCYYFTDQNHRNKLTSTTTPDGYTVDDQGRWTVNGVAQYNGYGTFKIGTDEKYAGKSDSERWITMRGLLENLYATTIPASQYGMAFASFDSHIWSTWPSGSLITNNTGNGDYIAASFGNYWNDSPEFYGDSDDECMEQTIKILCGDHAGQVLFDELRKAAEPAEGGVYEAPVYDANGKLDTYLDAYGIDKVRTTKYETSGDGINFKYMDMAKWTNGSMKTDYGKSIYVEPNYNKIAENLDSKTPVEWVLRIK